MRRIRNRKYKGLAVLALLALLAALLGSGQAYADGGPDEEEPGEDSGQGEYQRQIDAYNEKLEALDRERRQIQAQIDSAQTEKDRETTSRDAIQQQISVTQQEIGVLAGRYELLEESAARRQSGVEALKEDIREKQREYDGRYRLYLGRLQSMQCYDEGTVLGLLLGCDSYVDYLSASETMSRLAAYDRELMQGIKAERAALEQARRELEEEIDALEQQQAELAREQDLIRRKQDELAGQKAQAEDKIHDIERMEREFLADLESNQKLQQEMQAALDKVYEQMRWDENPYVGGEMAWPVPGYYQISSYYGPRFGGTDFHTGTDIYGAGIHGAQVVAANDGVVKFTNWTSTGRDYGVYIILDHGGELSTLYAHLSNIQVQEGQSVEKGQVIGNVGSTGWSTGPHLHFEVRISSQHTNSLPYIKGAE